MEDEVLVAEAKTHLAQLGDRGDSKTRFHHPEGVSANVPTDTFVLPTEIAAIKNGLLARHRAETENLQGDCSSTIR